MGESGSVSRLTGTAPLTLLWAASILQIRGHRWQPTPFALVPWETLVAALVLVPVAFAFSGPPPTEWDVRPSALLLYAAVPGTALAYWATAVASRDLPALTTSLGFLGTPVVSMIVAAVWLGEPLAFSLVIAMLLILGAVAVGATGPAPTGAGVRDGGVPRPRT